MLIGALRCVRCSNRLRPYCNFVNSRISRIIPEVRKPKKLAANRKRDYHDKLESSNFEGCGYEILWLTDQILPTRPKKKLFVVVSLVFSRQAGIGIDRHRHSLLGRCRGLPTSNRVLLLVYYRILEFHEFSPKYASKILREPIRSGIYSSRSNRLISRFVDMGYLPRTLADRPDFTDPACRSTRKAIRSRTPCFFSTGQFDRHSLFPGTCTYAAADQLLLLFQG